MIEKSIIAAIFQELARPTVLIDLGASGHYFEMWKSIAPYCTYVGFDPDQRDIQEIPNSIFKKAVIINQAITEDANRQQLDFYLTQSPHCSSTLSPLPSELAQYLYAPEFIVTKQVTAPATTLDNALKSLELQHIDWLKEDTQGLDLRIFLSINPHCRANILALDVEPGLINVYAGEDLFVDVQKNLLAEGFWLSNLAVLGSIRISQSSLTYLKQQGISLDERSAHQQSAFAPGWVGARYLRTLEWAMSHNYRAEQYLLLWLFAQMDLQKGFALDVILAYQQQFGETALSQRLLHESLRLIQQKKPVDWRKRLRENRVGWQIVRARRLFKRLTSI